MYDNGALNFFFPIKNIHTDGVIHAQITSINIFENKESTEYSVYSRSH